MIPKSCAPVLKRNYFSVSGIKIPNFLKCKKGTVYFILCGTVYVEEKKRIIKTLVEKADCIQGFFTVYQREIVVYISFLHIK